LNGYSKWDQAESFGWFLREFLGNAVKAMVLLDRDYRTDAQVSVVLSKFEAVDVVAHVWSRKELESYLILPSVIARLCECPEEAVASAVGRAMADMKNTVSSRLLSERWETERPTGKSAATISEQGLDEFDERWRQESFRLAVCPPKKILSSVNRYLQGNGQKAVSFEAIAKYATKEETNGQIGAGRSCLQLQHCSNRRPLPAPYQISCADGQAERN
jgi:hypothetical protein